MFAQKKEKYTCARTVIFSFQISMFPDRAVTVLPAPDVKFIFAHSVLKKW